MSETPTPPAETPGAPLLNGEAARGAETADTRDWLPEAFRASPVFKDIASVEALAKSYDGAARLVGLDKAQVLRIPAPDDEAGQAEMFARLGRPEKPEGYEFPELPGALVEGVEPAARQAFHKLGLTAAQAKGVMELYGGQITAAETTRLARAAEVEAAVVADLRREWGDAFDDRLHGANRVIAELGGEALDKLVRETRMPDGTMMGNHPVLIKFLAEIGQKLGEPGTLKGGSAGQGGAASYTPDEAAAELKALRGDTEFHTARRNPKHPDHAAATEKWNRLNLAATAGRSWMG
jgi:hypothetical protein